MSIGDATLVITDMNDQALTHWSLAAVQRENPGTRPALYFPDGDPGETLELTTNEAEMIDAIETLRRAIEKARPHPGRLRWLSVVVSVAVVAALLILWLPGAMREHSLRVVPQVKHDALGRTLLARIERVSGKQCRDRASVAALSQLSQRLDTGPIAILPNMTRASLHLPGGLIVISSALVEDYEEPDVVAGYIVTEKLRQDVGNPLRDLLRAVGLRENFRLLTTGDIADEALNAYAEHLMISPPSPLDAAAQLAAFEATGLRSTPYAYARDITGETTLPLIEGDPMSGREPVLLMSDAHWLRLQNICGG